MQDILIHLFQFAGFELKQSLLLINKQLNKLKYNDFINDNISEHILTNKGYLNVELYNQIKENIEFIQRYNEDFDINKQVLFLYHTGLTKMDLTGLNNLREIKLDFNKLTNIDLTKLINLRILYLYNNKLINIDLNGLDNLQRINLYQNQLTDNVKKYIQSLDIEYYL